MTEAVTRVLPFPLIILIGLGFFVVPWSVERALVNLYLLSYIIFFWFILIPVFHINSRYFVPLLPISFIWIAQGAEQFINWLSETLQSTVKNWPKLFSFKVVSVVAVVFFILVGSIFPEFSRHMKKDPNSTEEWAPSVEQKKAGLWLKENGIKNSIIMAYNHAVSFYSGNYEIKESVEIPENEIGRVLAYARHRGVKYLVLSDRYKQHHPLIKDIYEERNLPQSLKLIYFEQAESGLKTLIYEIVD